MLEAEEDGARKKAALRKQIRQTREALSAAEVETASRAICRQLAALDSVRQAQTIALYAPVRGEVDVTSLLSGAPTCAFPRIDGDELAFHLVRAMSELEPAPFGLREPHPAAPRTHAIDVVVVPALGFDRRGHRLGYGRGYYDRALSRMSPALRVGVCHEFQLIDQVPNVAQDEPVDLIITPSERVETHSRSKENLS